MESHRIRKGKLQTRGQPPSINAGPFASVINNLRLRNSWRAISLRFQAKTLSLGHRNGRSNFDEGRAQDCGCRGREQGEHVRVIMVSQEPRFSQQQEHPRASLCQTTTSCLLLWCSRFAIASFLFCLSQRPIFGSSMWEYVFDVTGYMFSSDVVSALEKYGSELVNSVMQRTEAIIRNYGTNVSIDLLIL